MRSLLISLIFTFQYLISSGQPTDSIDLIRNGKICFHIVSEPKTEIAIPAINLFSQYVRQIADSKSPITDSNQHFSSRFIFRSSDDNTIKPEGFKVSTQLRDIIIEAGDSSGLCNAVYYLLEHLFDCRYYSPEAQIIPKKESLKIGPYETIQNPAFEFRVNYNGGAFNKSFATWHALHNIPQKPDSPHFDISDNWGIWVHTFHKLLPPEKWFETHPEYFALRNGVRIPDQLCLSNPDVLHICTEELQRQMNLKPNAKYWSVSQMDNFNYCECENCKAIDAANSSPSGIMISFVNQIADKFPDKIISTLAYQYTRTAPSNVVPLSNVNIMLCSIECNRDKPIAADTSKSGFYNDLKEWSKISDNIIVWDYVINFSNIIGPFPNLYILKLNLQLFRENNVKMIFEQGWPRPSGEFTELRCYLLSKLMWNPDLDTDSLINDFCIGFYGAGGNYIYDYIKLSTENLVLSGKNLTLYEPMSVHANGFLSPQNLETYFKLFQKALDANNNTEPYQQRIQMAMQPVRYAWLEVAKSLPFTDNWIFVKDNSGIYNPSDKAQKLLIELYELAKANGPSLFHETSIPPQEYYDRMTMYFTNGVQMHKAVGKSIVFEKPYSPNYTANGPNSLIDGVCGTENYFSLWQGWYGEDIFATIDLGKSETVSSIKINSLINQLSWIFPPEKITVFGSTNGTDFLELGQFVNDGARLKANASIAAFQINLNTPANYRFIKINIKNIGNLPDWRGVDGKAWLFLDEIIIN